MGWAVSLSFGVAQTTSGGHDESWGNFAVQEECWLLLSSCGDILSMLGNRLSGSGPVDKAFSGFSEAFFLEKLDENKKYGNHRSTWKAVNWVKGGSHNHGRTFDDF
ncbi:MULTISPECIES: hypothetical protein [unclassified Rhizobium]|nr:MULTISPECIES: hypothetical protein [unclassified Rhizobium]MBB3540859.1 hypothetical protein [Rhizobium sp. BK399]MCS3741484.1 hypothetical protein [Rhizobium sp. BK661]MCS4092906.1 hypothetical protein [Rhizobium sp. BK176]